MDITYRVVKVADKTVNIFIGIVLVLILLFGVYNIWDVASVLDQSSAEALLPYKPPEDAPGEAWARLMEINQDVCGWLTLDDTGIDYPLLMGESNSTYLNRDLFGDHSVGGSLFLDYRNSRDFSDFTTIIYGHNMTQGKMFGNLVKYDDKKYFDTHLTGRIYTLEGVNELEVFAFIRTDAFDKVIYNPVRESEESKREFYDYVKKAADNYRDLELSNKDRILVLSTCYSTTTDGRDILLARIVP